MNLGEIKAFIGDKPTQAPAVQDARQQIREMGLRQAADFAGKQVTAAQSVFSSNTAIGLKVYNNSLGKNVSIDDRHPNLPDPKSKEASLFDFEEVARNVLKFVGGAIKHAAAKGADEEKLMAMFEQARSGVLKGIEMAEKDLAGFMNEEIKAGIANSYDLIDSGINKLQQQIFGRDDDEKLQSDAELSILNYSSSRTSELSINTRDGDTVTIQFGSYRELTASREKLEESVFQKPVEPDPEFVADQPRQPIDEVLEADNAQSAPQVSEPEAESVLIGTTGFKDPANPPSLQSEVQNEPVVNEQQAPENTDRVRQNILYRESEAFSFSVSGDLDEAELAAIGDLVDDAADLAKTFFEGDIQGAFQQALDLGYDEQELTGFAFQLTRQEKVEAVNVYEKVSHLDDEANSYNNPAKAIKPISDYLEKMLNVFEKSQQKLENNDAYEQLLNGIVNNIEDVGTSDLLTAINQFHKFNRDLLQNLNPVQS